MLNVRAIIVILALFAAACHRPFVEISSPSIEVIEPDLSVVFVQNEIRLVIRASSFREVSRVELNGAEMGYDSLRDEWSADVTLQRGINELVLGAFDIEEIPQYDTLHAVHLPFQISPTAPRLLDGRGGHAATLLKDEALLVTGGAARTGGDATRDAVVLSSGAFNFSGLSARMSEARAGHSATLMPDGRVLIIGGARVDEVDTVENLVETVEVFEPLTGEFRTIIFEGDPIRRAYHTVSTRQSGESTIVDIYGGRGDIQYIPSPRLGTRRDARSFVFRRDSLIALSPGVGPTFPAAMWGHVQFPIDTELPSEALRFIYAGAFFGNGFVDNISFQIDYSNPQVILTGTADDLLEPRIRHAAAKLADGLVLISGGRGELPTDPVISLEMFVVPARRFISMPKGANLTPRARFGHTATLMPDGRIMLLGGFRPEGTPVDESEFVTFSL